MGTPDEKSQGVEGVVKTMNLVLDGYDYEVEFLAQNLVTSAKVNHPPTHLLPSFSSPSNPQTHPSTEQ